MSTRLHRRTLKTVAAALVAAGAVASDGTARAAVTPDVMGDTVNETLYASNDGASRNLTNLLNNYTNPISGTPAPITRPDGSSLVVGDTTLGQNPNTSDQIQYQRFLVGGDDATIRIRYYGGIAGYRNVFGAYSYSAAADPTSASLTFLPLFTQNVSPLYQDIFFTISKGSYFGFYLNANGSTDADQTFFTENFRNKDGPSGVTTDHFLTFNTNQGLLLAIEDIQWTALNDGKGKGKSLSVDGRLGDQDYNDLMVSMITYSDGTPLTAAAPAVPEPASLALLLAGGALLVPRRGKRLQRA